MRVPGPGAEPEHRLLDVAVVRDPLGLGVGRHGLVRDAGRHLERADGGPPTGLDRPGQRRGVRLGVEDPAARGAPGGVGEDRVETGDVDLGDIRAAHLDQVGQAQGGGVGGEGGTGRRVPVDREHLDPGPGQGQDVAADAAAEVGQPLHPESGEPFGPPLGDLAPGGLLHAVGREVHEVGVGAELGPGPLPQPGLPEGGRHEVGGVLLAQPGGECQLLLGRELAQFGEQGLAPLGQQGPQVVVLHPLILPGHGRARGAGPAGGSAPPRVRPTGPARVALALWLTEC